MGEQAAKSLKESGQADSSSSQRKNDGLVLILPLIRCFDVFSSNNSQHFRMNGSPGTTVYWPPWMDMVIHFINGQYSTIWEEHLCPI